jgi:hypothetical protein
MVERELEIANRGWPQIYIEHRFAVLLVILFLLLAEPPILFGFGLSAGWLDGVIAMLMLAAILSLCFERHQRLFALVLGMPTIAFCLGGHAFSGPFGAEVLLFGHACQILFFLGAAGLIVKSLFNARSLTFDSIFGAVCGYLFLGLGWAVLYSVVELYRPGSFQISQSLMTDDQPARPLPHVLTYYSFVTLTTVGYGDIHPFSPATRTFAWIEAITGQFYLAVIVAGLVSMLVTRPNPHDGGKGKAAREIRCQFILFFRRSLMVA